MTDLLALREQLDEELAARVKAGVCGCGCGTTVSRGGNGRRKYVDQTHRQARYRYTLRRLAEAEGMPTRLSLRLVEATNATHDRHGDAQKPGRKRQSKPRPGLSVYFPTVIDAERAAEWIDHLRVGPDATAELDPAAQALGRALERHARKAAA